jgi:murein DD-endopeptidase MepM/ murein hydrolase activator NlpD
MIMLEKNLSYTNSTLITLLVLIIIGCSPYQSNQTIVIKETIWKENPVLASIPIQNAKEYLTTSYIVQNGDTLEKIFISLDIFTPIAYRLSNGFSDVTNFQFLMPGEELIFYRDDVSFIGVERILNLSTSVIFWFNNNEIHFEITERPTEIKLKGIHHKITNSLFLAGIEVGLGDSIIMSLANIFQWEIDFIQDIRPDDQFSIIYEVYIQDGLEVGQGNILAAEFLNNGSRYEAFRYTDSENNLTGYYNRDGRSLRRSFLRAPLEFSRVSSNFNPNRRHPILNSIKAHRGVDYAAPYGTPIRAAGAGEIVFEGIDGGYGNTIVIDHGGDITTLYAHLSRFSEYIVNDEVNQEDIIGYVGQSGLATGPHLHYEYRINNIHQDPRTVALPQAEPITIAEKVSFNEQSAPFLELLEALSKDEMAILDIEL